MIPVGPHTNAVVVNYPAVRAVAQHPAVPQADPEVQIVAHRHLNPGMTLYQEHILGSINDSHDGH